MKTKSVAKLNIKPVSVNSVWQGRRFKTPVYNQYEKDLSILLPKMKIPEGKLEIKITYGFSNKASDIDNPTKPFLDILQKKYGFDDKRIYKMTLDKVDVPKGEEFIEFELSPLDG